MILDPDKPVKLGEYGDVEGAGTNSSEAEPAAPIWELDPLAFIVARRFPRYATLQQAEIRDGHSSLENEYSDTLIKVEALTAELARMSESEFLTTLDQEKSAFFAERAREVERMDNLRFFSSSYAVVDIHYWATLSYWTVEESVALSFGLDPRLVNWAAIEQYFGSSIFVYSYIERFERVRRAAEAGQLLEKNTPTFFLAWALRTRFYMPEALVAEVVSLGQQVADWKTEYDRLTDLIRAMSSQHEQDKAQAGVRIEELRTLGLNLFNEHLELEKAHAAVLDELKSYKSKPEARSPSGAADARERYTMLKLIYGMAVAFYGYDPSANRNNAASQIESDLLLKGFKVSNDTVRRYLNEAKQKVIPGDEG